MRVKLRALGLQVTHAVETNDDEPRASTRPASIPPAPSGREGALPR